MSPDARAHDARLERTANTFSPRQAAVASAIGLAVVFVALHLPYLPASLEDHDSINFALGVNHFDVARHQPHPPGYPLFIVLAKAVHAVVPRAATALALVSVISAGLGVLAIAWLFRQLDERDGSARWLVAATALTMATPLFWFTAARPLSDSSGLAAAVAVQAMTLTARRTRALAVAAFCAGLAAGLRSQVVWLTVPLLAFRAIERPGSFQSLRPVGAAFLAGIALWLVPLVVVSGGPSAYWHALADQGGEDLGNIQMLWNNHAAHDIVDALYYAFVSPWAWWPVAAVALTCSVAGIWRGAMHQRRALIVLAVAFGPYLVFDLLFQETFPTRYALPLVVPMAYLAVMGLRLAPWDLGLAGAIALTMFCAHLGGTSVAAYSRAASPAFRLLETMRMVTRVERVTPVLAMDRRQSLDFLRPITWAGDAMPAVAATLKAPPQHEWMEAANYWNGGGRNPVWFVVDPRRSSIDLVQHGAAVPFRWAVPYPVLLSGTRPDEMDWYRVERPEWYAGEGWALTPEAAGVAAADGRGPSLAPIDGWVSDRVLGGVLMIGGRSFDPAATARLTVRIEGRPVLDDRVAPGPFLRFVALPLELIASPSREAYRKVTVEASRGSRVAVEQFDASRTRTLLGFGEGWHEREFEPRTGARWRWLSERGELQLRSPAPNVILHLEGESPLKYFARGSRLVVRAGSRVLFDEVLSADFVRDVAVPEAGAAVVLETDQVYIPAERRWRGGADRRHLGLRIFKAEIRPADRPAF